MVLENGCFGHGGASDCGERVLSKLSSGYVGCRQYFVSSVADVLTRVSACSVGMGKSMVLETGGWRDMLKGALWRFVIALLVGGTLANQASEAKGVTGPPPQYDEQRLKMLEISLALVVSIMGHRSCPFIYICQ